MGPNPLTLFEFTGRISGAISSRPDLRCAWVSAEMIDLRVSGGHCYMELIEKDEAGRTVAKLRAMIWRQNLQPLRTKFYNATGKDIGSGLKVLVRLTASFHPLFGLSATIDDIDPSYTLGDLERIRKEILQRLQNEGLINNNKSLSLEAVPQKIAVISSPTAAGYQDFINQIENNSGGFVFYTKLFEAVMQGSQTSVSVRNALERIEMAIDLFDCVVIIRGGGATTDMNGFDDYELARMVASYSLPVIIGIGHERDNCVLDYIANVRCKTPTAVAAFLIDRATRTWQRAVSLAQQIARYATDRIEGEKRITSQIQTMLFSLSEGIIEKERLKLSHLRDSLPLSLGRLMALAGTRLESDMKMLRIAASHVHDIEVARLTQLQTDLSLYPGKALLAHNEKIESLARLIDAYSPVNTLKRGYSITLHDGKAVTEPGELRAGTVLETILRNGRIESVVEKIAEEPDLIDKDGIK